MPCSRSAAPAAGAGVHRSARECLRRPHCRACRGSSARRRRLGGRLRVPGRRPRARCPVSSTATPARWCHGWRRAMVRGHAIARALCRHGHAGRPPRWQRRRGARLRSRGDPRRAAVARASGLPCVRLLDRRPGPPQTGSPRRRVAPARSSPLAAPPLRACCSSTTSPLPAPRSRRRPPRCASRARRTVVAVTAARTPPPGSA